MKYRGCRGRVSKRRHREAWLKRIGAAWVVAHQDGAVEGTAQDIGQYYDEKRGQSSCRAVAEKSLGDVHREDAGGSGQRPQQEAGDRDSPGRATAHSDVFVADGGLGLGLPGAAVAAAVEVTGIAEEKTQPGGAALGVEVRIKDGSVAHHEEGKTTGAAHREDAAHQEEKEIETVGAATAGREDNGHRFLWCVRQWWWWLWLGLSGASLCTRPEDVTMTVAIPIAVIGAGFLTGTVKVLLLVAARWRQCWWFFLWSPVALLTNCSGVGFLCGVALSAAVVWVVGGAAETGKTEGTAPS